MNNTAEYSVSQLSAALKKVIETDFAHVRVRGELGRVTRAGSGHLYLDLKDERAVLSGVMWKGSAARLAVKPEQGLEVIASGRLTTYPGQSRYQIIIDTLELAGEGALMALLEKRKKTLAAEGLFDEARKKPLPYLPAVIGVVTSPSGAVIRDILHRLRARFARHVILWPTLVQGDRAAAQITAAITGFNQLSPDGEIPRPDVLIVGRGGGSLEDLWCFNEENVVRAIAASEIPVISAVGHETDTTLADFAADRRAPTPTAAAEMAVPVRDELIAEMANKTRRMTGALRRYHEGYALSLKAAMRGLGSPMRLLEGPNQRLDRAGQAFTAALVAGLSRAQRLFDRAGAGLRPLSVKTLVMHQTARLEVLEPRLGQAVRHITARAGARLAANGKLLDSLSYRGVLARGFALVTDEAGAAMRSVTQAHEGARGMIQFSDGISGIEFRAPTTGMSDSQDSAEPPRRMKQKKSITSRNKPQSQKTLFD